MQNVGVMMQVVCALPGQVSAGILRGSPDTPIAIVVQFLSMESTLFTAYSFGIHFIHLRIDDMTYDPGSVSGAPASIPGCRRVPN